MEKPEGILGVCSGCAGDYEDPERSAWSDDAADDPEGDEGPNEQEIAPLNENPQGNE